MPNLHGGHSVKYGHLNNGPLWHIIRHDGDNAWAVIATTSTIEDAQLLVDALNDHQAVADLRASLEEPKL